MLNQSYTKCTLKSAYHKRFWGICASILLLGAQSAQAGETVAVQVVSEPAPVISLLNVDGQPEVIDFKGDKVKVLHFWATWCVPCVAELPELDALYGKVKDKITVIPVSLDGAKNIEKVKTFYKLYKIKNLPIYMDDKNVAFRDAKGKVLPTTLFLKNEKVTGRADGALDWSKTIMESN